MRSLAAGVVGAGVVGFLAFGLIGTGGSKRGPVVIPEQAAAVGSPAAPASGLADCVVSPGGKVGNVPLQPVQAATAKTIVSAAAAAGVGEAGARIGVAAALVEAQLKNPNGGDHSSIGAFQELAGNRSGFKLTDAQRLDVGGAAARFFTKLKAVKGWQGMDPGDAAQAVQHSGFPARYAAKMSLATQVVAQVRGQSAASTCSVPALAGDCPPTGKPAERGLQPAALRGLRCGLKVFPKIQTVGGVGGRPNKSDHPAGRAVDFMIDDWRTPAGKTYGWTAAKWWQKNAAALNVKYVIWDAKIWRSGSSAWTAYSHPTGGTSPTLMHLDHVHVSFRD